MNAIKLSLTLLLLAALAGCEAKYDPEPAEWHRLSRDDSDRPGYCPPAREPEARCPAPAPRVAPAEESYDRPADNPALSAQRRPLSTFSIDVDTASYANVRRFLNQGQLPPPDAVRVEELVNYFSYSYNQPGLFDGSPLAVHLAAASCPWAPDHRLVRVGIKGRELPGDRRPRGNYVFLIDVSGSMADANKLPLAQTALRMLVDRLDRRDRVAIVTYAGDSGVALDSTPCSRKDLILRVLDSLQAGGNTNGSAGIRDAYRLAWNHFVPNGVNRVILCTDGDFNVGTTDKDELVSLVRRESARGVYLTVLGFGMGNLKDSTLEQIADKGHGQYAYVDSIHEARKVLVEQVGSTLVPVARDVKVQVEFNPAVVSSWRLVGYENRLMRARDFNDDSKDAADLGAGAAVTALYEITPVCVADGDVDSLKYQSDGRRRSRAASRETLTLKVRYKDPDGSQSKRIERTLVDPGDRIEQADSDFRFAAAVASFGLILGESPHRGDICLPTVLELASGAASTDPDGRRAEFLQLIRTASALKRR